MATEAIIKPEVQQLETALGTLRTEAKSIIGLGIKTADQYEKCGALLVAAKNYEKDVHSKLDAFVEIPRRAYEAARTERQKYLNQAQEVTAMVSGPMSDFKRREREAAEAEQRRINDERRVEAERLAEKQRHEDELRAKEEREKREKEIKEALKAGELKKREAEKMRKEAEERERLQREQAAKDAEAAKANVQQVTVQPATPKISSLRGRVNYYAEFKNLAALLDAFVDARVKSNIERATYLRKFICGDDKALGKEARDTKDSKKLENLIPGIRAWDEDSI